MAGPFYQFDPILDSAIKLPEYLEGALIMYDWSRDRFWEVRMDENGDILKINRTFGTLAFSSPIDAKVGPDGAIYVIEWGTPKFGRNNANAKLVRVEFVGSLPALLGDYNKDDTVNAADYTVYRNALGATGLTPFSGADGTGDGKVTMDDYDVWKLHYGDTLPMAGAGAGEEIVRSDSVVQLVTELGSATQTGGTGALDRRLGPATWFGIFATRHSAIGEGVGRKAFSLDPSAQAPARDQALSELFDQEVDCRKVAGQHVHRVDMDSETINVLSNWMGDRFAGSFGRKIFGTSGLRTLSGTGQGVRNLSQLF
jgi:hypothetical protein